MNKINDFIKKNINDINLSNIIFNNMNVSNDDSIIIGGYLSENKQIKFKKIEFIRGSNTLKLLKKYYPNSYFSEIYGDIKLILPLLYNPIKNNNINQNKYLFISNTMDYDLYKNKFIFIIYYFLFI